jgi:hypothetical protein
MPPFCSVCSVRVRCLDYRVPSLMAFGRLGLVSLPVQCVNGRSERTPVQFMVYILAPVHPYYRWSRVCFRLPCFTPILPLLVFFQDSRSVCRCGRPLHRSNQYRLCAECSRSATRGGTSRSPCPTWAAVCRQNLSQHQSDKRQCSPPDGAEENSCHARRQLTPATVRPLE